VISRRHVKCLAQCCLTIVQKGAYYWAKNKCFLGARHHSKYLSYIYTYIYQYIHRYICMYIYQKEYRVISSYDQLVSIKSMVVDLIIGTTLWGKYYFDSAYELGSSENLGTHPGPVELGVKSGVLPRKTVCWITVEFCYSLFNITPTAVRCLTQQLILFFAIFSLWSFPSQWWVF
jgi:hypothetical protein